MSDLNLTPEQWRMARQAGAATDSSGRLAAEDDRPLQLSIDTLGPAPGETWRNVHTLTIGTVERVDQRRYTWVTMRRDGRSTTFPLTDLEKHWERCRPDGTPL